MCVLSFAGVGKQYHYDEFALFDEVDFEVKEGEVVGVVADKQCGKTTIAKMIAGLTKPTKGQIFYCGLPLEQTPPRLRKIGVVFDDLALMEKKTVFKNLCYPLKVRKIKDFSAADRAMKLFGLEQVKDVKVKDLAKQDKAKAAFARLSLRELDLLVVDEAERNIDRESAIEYMRRINARATLMLSSNVDSLSNCGKVAVLAEGKTAFCGTFEEAKQFVEQSKCFDKFAIDEEMKRLKDA